MANSFNNVTLIGRVVDIPEMRSTQGGTQLVRFRLAVDRSYQKDGEKKADFISCVAWRQLAETISKYVGKGRLILVTGELQGSQHEEPETGKKRTDFSVQVERFVFLGTKNEGETQKTESVEVKVDESLFDDGDLPF